MLQVAPPLANETVEGAAIALLEAESVDGIAGILLETCLARSKASRGAVFLVSDGSMAIAKIDGGSGISVVSQAELLSHVRKALGEGAATTLAGIASAFDGVVAPLERAINERRRRTAAQTAATKVDFFTLVRGES